MSTTVSNGRVVLVRFNGHSSQTDHYESLEDMLEQVLMNSGDKIPFLVRDKLLPPAIEAWETTIKQDNCEHVFVKGICKRCELVD